MYSNDAPICSRKLARANAMVAAAAFNVPVDMVATGNLIVHMPFAIQMDDTWCRLLPAEIPRAYIAQASCKASVYAFAGGAVGDILGGVRAVLAVDCGRIV